MLEKFPLPAILSASEANKPASASEPEPSVETKSASLHIEQLNIEVDILFRFSAHGDKRDLKGLEKDLKDADIFIPEAFGWQPELITAFQSIADGLVKPDDSPLYPYVQQTGDFSDYQIGLLNTLYNTHLKIDVIDIPDWRNLDPMSDASEIHALQKIEQLQQEGITSHRKALFFWERGRLTEALPLGRKFFANWGEAERFREACIVKNLKKLIVSRAKDGQFPRRKLKVVVTLGSLHSHVIRFAKQELPSAQMSRVFEPTTPTFLFSYSGEAQRLAALGKPVPDELIIRDFFEYNVRNYIGEEVFARSKKEHFLDETLPNKSYLLDRVVRFIVSKFTLDEIRRFCVDVPEKIEFIDVFKEKGIPLPQTKQQLEQIVQRLRKEDLEKTGRKSV